ncbi:AraC family transcriptional regulator [Companilactobacillus baiquanensis]|uniref:Helix-turn-helix domain-containing protein n=1 Tax=Companilactobacillus baiquanensis TaxID=2486005 RepID=A0ABW1UVR1_9LACO|nr:helix-turn-helix domain-containing protein [Companilactobacillus baiquanensis]
MNGRLDNFLFHETSIEKAQRKTKHFVADFPDAALINHDQQMKFNNSFFFKNKSIFINKHNRYADYPLHSHEFLEINYIYSGHCTQIINGKQVNLNKGDLVILDINSKHSIKALGKHDILINILFQNKEINLNWLDSLKSNQSVLFNFLLNASMSKQNQSQYLLFKNKQSVTIKPEIQEILSEYFFPHEFSGTVISSYLDILLTKLLRQYSPEMIKNNNVSQDSTLKQVFNEIEKNSKTLTLNSLAELMNYNKNYLSNLIKNETGFTFTELLNKQKILKAHLAVVSTGKSIQDIIDEVGYSNRNYFYKIYFENYDELPSETRKKLRTMD